MALGNGILALCVIAALSVAFNAEACSTCADQGTIETNEPCKSCQSRGKVTQMISRTCTGCSGTGKQWYYRNQGPRFCKPCGGTGMLKQKADYTCGSCSGSGRITRLITCPSCRGASADSGGDGVRQPNAPAATTAGSMVQIEACTLCGPDGKVTRPVEIGCKLCEKGFSHKKETADGKDVYRCRKCGKVCDDRYAPCPCKKPDCPDCGKIEKLTETVTCPACGGDGLITPMERARLNQTTKAAEAAK